MLGLLLAGALFAKALAEEATVAAHDAPYPDRSLDEPLNQYSKQMVEVIRHVSNATTCYKKYVSEVKAADFASEALLSTIDDCHRENDASESQLKDARETARKPSFPTDRLWGLKLPNVLDDRKDLRGKWTDDFVDSLEKLERASEQAVQIRNEQRQPGKLKPWIYPNEMKCYGDIPAPENCLGTKAFCDGQGSESERCLQSRERPKYQVGLQANCKNDPSQSGEACRGTEHWCSKHQMVQIWGSSQSCIDYRQTDGGQRSNSWREGSGCSEKTEACLGTFSWCALYYQETYSSQEACFGDRRHRPKDTKKGEWKFGDASFFADSENRNGTEVLCLAIESPETRTECYNAREPAPWRFPFSADCPVDGDLDDERCMGTKGWCERQKEIYKSLEGCLSARQRAAEHSDLAWQYGEACAERSEKCLGTDKACSLLQGPELRNTCTAARSEPGFLLPDSRSCSGQGSAGERCIGTFEWCLNHWNDQGFTYQDEYACYAKHGFDALSFEHSITDAVEKMVEDGILNAGQNVAARALYRELAVNKQPLDRVKESTKGDLSRFLEKVSKTLLKEGKARQAVERALS